MIRLALVDDHKLFLSGVRSELEEAVDIVGVYTDVDEAVEQIRDTEPDVVLVDVHMPGGGGFGPVSQRERARIEHDLAMGYITPEGRARDYPR